MSLAIADGFEDMDVTNYNQILSNRFQSTSGGGASIIPNDLALPTGRFGHSQAARVLQAKKLSLRTRTTSWTYTSDEVILSCAIKLANPNDITGPESRPPARFMACYKSDVRQVSLRIVNNGDGTYKLQGAVGSSDALIHASAVSPNLVDGNWYFIEWKVDVKTGTGGSMSLKIDETQVFSVTGINTASQGTNGIHTIHWRVGAKNVAGSVCEIDDMVAISIDGTAPNDFWGAVKIGSKTPSTDGTFNQWDLVGSEPTRAQAMANLTTLDYVKTDLLSKIQSFNWTALSGITGSDQILGVFMHCSTWLGTAGTRSFSMGTKDNFRPAKTVNLTAVSSFPNQFERMIVDPDDGLAWDFADLEAKQFAYKS